jgi:hypothetical protein
MLSEAGDFFFFSFLIDFFSSGISQEQERRLRQTPARRTTSNYWKVKQSISEQSLNAREGDGEKRQHLLIWKRTF